MNPLGDVHPRGLHRRFSIPHGDADHDLDPELGAVLAPRAELVLGGRLFSPQALFVVSPQPIPVRIVNHVIHPEIRDHFSRIIEPEHGGQGLVGAQNAVVAVNPDALHRSFHQPFELLLHLEKFLFGMFPGADVAQEERKNSILVRVDLRQVRLGGKMAPILAHTQHFVPDGCIPEFFRRRRSIQELQEVVFL